MGTTQGPPVSFATRPPGNSNSLFGPTSSNNSGLPPTSISAGKVPRVKDPMYFRNPHASNLFANPAPSLSTSAAPQIPVSQFQQPPPPPPPHQSPQFPGRPGIPETFLQAMQTASTATPYSDFLQQYASRQALAAGTSGTASLAEQQTTPASGGMLETDTEDDDEDDSGVSESETSFHSCNSDSGSKQMTNLLGANVEITVYVGKCVLHRADLCTLSRPLSVWQH